MSVSMVDGHVDPDKGRMTNYEKIKAMSIDEMAEYFLTKSFDPCDITNFPVVDCDAGCDKCIRKWLESEVEEE